MIISFISQLSLYCYEYLTIGRREALLYFSKESINTKNSCGWVREKVVSWEIYALSAVLDFLALFLHRIEGMDVAAEIVEGLSE